MSDLHVSQDAYDCSSPSHFQFVHVGYVYLNIHFSFEYNKCQWLLHMIERGSHI